MVHSSRRETADADDLGKMKDRFPLKLRVHLGVTNIRDVVHRRLLQKTPDGEQKLRERFRLHREDVKLFAYGGDAITEEDFVEVYPMLPGHIDLLMQITSALRTRSTRTQGDDQAIRGLLQLLGELFRERRLADLPLGALVTLDEIYEVQHTALGTDAQASMARVLSHCQDDPSGLMARVARAVALLELICETTPTDARLVAQCLFDRLDRGDQQARVTEALEDLRRRNLLGYSEKYGYKLQSSAAEEWERERRDIPVTRDQSVEHVQEALKLLLGDCDQPSHMGRDFPWSATFSDGRRADDVTIKGTRDEAAVAIDFRLLTVAEQTPATWVRRSDEGALRDRLLWVAGETDALEHDVRELARSLAMVKKYKLRRDSLPGPKKLLLQQEENRAEDLTDSVKSAVSTAWIAGHMYFRGRPLVLGGGFKSALTGAATSIMPDLYPHYLPVTVLPSELSQLLLPEVTSTIAKLFSHPGGLGILELDGGRPVTACGGVVPRRVQEFLEREGGASGATLLSTFARPPYGYHESVVRTCAAGLLRAGRLQVRLEDGTEIVAVRDMGVQDLFEKDRTFRRATFFPPQGDDDVTFSDRERICRFLADSLRHPIDREDHLIADAVAQLFPPIVVRLRGVLGRLNQVPGSPPTPTPLARLERALEACIRVVRQTKLTVKEFKRQLDALRDGIQLLDLYDAELTDATLRGLRVAADVRNHQVAQLRESRDADTAWHPAAERLERHLTSERPWQALSVLDPDLAEIRAAYARERGRLLAAQQTLAEEACARIKQREGYDTFSADQSYQVLRPIVVATSSTTEDAVAPPLRDLRDGFRSTLADTEERANEIFDELIDHLVVKVDLNLAYRELRTAADLDALLGEIRARLEEPLGRGARVRLV